MQLKTRQIIVMLNLDCFRSVGSTATMYTSFGSPSLGWQTSQLFSHLWNTKLFGEAMSSYAAFNGEHHADDYTGASSCSLVYTQAMIFAIMMTLHCKVFRQMKYWRIALKPPICQNKFPAKISGHTAHSASCMPCWATRTVHWQGKGTDVEQKWFP